MAGLELRFGNLDEEQRQMAANELHAFRRHQGETTDELLSRYTIVRNRARLEGNFTQSVEQNANQLLRAIGVTPEQMVELYTPFGVHPPTTEAEFLQPSTMAHP